MAIAAAFIVGLGDGARARSDPPSAPVVVYCYDRDRDVVSHVIAGECRGTVVSEDAAQELSERRELRIKRAVGAEPRIGRDGLRLASLGTAFYVDESGRVLTNHHVVVDCKLVTLMDAGEERPARVLAVDAANDLALLQGDAKAGGVAVFGFEGDAGLHSALAAVGYPDQGLPPREPLMTPGNLMGVADVGSSAQRLVIAADIRKGNSGGPIFDDRGRVIGVVNAKIDPVRVYEKTGRDVDDVGLGIPLSTVLEFLRRNDARFHQAKGGAKLEPGQILSLARQFVVRADCWK